MLVPLLRFAFTLPSPPITLLKFSPILDLLFASWLITRIQLSQILDNGRCYLIFVKVFEIWSFKSYTKRHKMTKFHKIFIMTPDISETTTDSCKNMCVQNVVKRVACSVVKTVFPYFILFSRKFQIPRKFQELLENLSMFYIYICDVITYEELTFNILCSQHW